MKKKKQNIHFDFHMDMAEPEVGRGIALGILGTLFILGTILAWVYLFSLNRSDSGRVLLVEGIVLFLLLAGNIFTICRIGYDGFFKNMAVTWAVGSVLSAVGFYMADIHVLAVPEGGKLLWGVMDFLLILGGALFLSCVPALIICVVMWGIMYIFGK